MHLITSALAYFYIKQPAKEFSVKKLLQVPELLLERNGLLLLQSYKTIILGGINP